ncbi:MAG: glycosyltransferase family 2 protein [Microcella sp.]|uniref:glycosyltransferase family 2 protein n=1 Tax=Microcella sp. TaxID=1913979 RepID=UPI003314C799
MSSITASIVIPNFNGEAFLRAAVESVIAQGEDVECIVVDGGSTDDSIEILKQYGERIRWISEKDEGQSDAIRKGMERVDTELVGWLNSDDVLLPDAIAAVRKAAERSPRAVLFHGDVERIDQFGRYFALARSPDLTLDKMLEGKGKVLQPGSMYRTSAVREAGGLDERYHLLMDLDLWIRLLQVGVAENLRRRLAQFRVHEAAKSSQAPYRYYRESLLVAYRNNPGSRASAIARRVAIIAIQHARYLADPLGAHRSVPPPPSSPLRVRIDGVPAWIEESCRQLASLGKLELVTQHPVDVQIVGGSRSGGRRRTPTPTVVVLDEPNRRASAEALSLASAVLVDAPNESVAAMGVPGWRLCSLDHAGLAEGIELARGRPFFDDSQ